MTQFISIHGYGEDDGSIIDGGRFGESGGGPVIDEPGIAVSF